MKIELDHSSDQHYRIQAYASGSVIINETHYSTSLIVSPERIISEWPPQTFAELSAGHMEMILDLQPEVVIVGTGHDLQFPSADVLDPLLAHAIGFEIMDTGAACRSYNILVGEGRRVAAALLLIESD